MKDSFICPKCGSNEILVIPGKAGPYGSGNNVPIGLTIFSYVKITRFLCCNCGFVEEWVEQKSDIEKLKKQYGAERI